MISCNDVLDLLPEAMPVLIGEAIQVHEHLKVCADCQEEADQVAHTLAALQAELDPAPDLGDDFADRVLAALPDAPAAAPPAEAPPEGKVIKLAPAIPLWLQAAAAAAVFACGVGVARLDQRSATQPAPGETAKTTTSDPAPRQVAQQGPTPRVLPVSTAGDPLRTYVSEASLVLQAVDSLDASDPKVLTLLRKHLERTALLEQGEQLMIVLDRDPRRGRRLRPLIRGTQLILRKVRHTDPQGDARAAAWAIRREVRQTRILDAYRDLTRPQTDDPRPNQPGVINVNDPL